MVLPLIVGLGLAATAGGTLLGSMLGGKKGDTITNAQIYHQPYEVYQPQIQYSPATSYAYTGPSYIVNSPNSAINKKTEAVSTASPSQTGEWTTPTTTSTAGTVGTGIDWTMLAIIGAVGIVGYAFFMGKK
jgi:hypothetical protein